MTISIKNRQAIVKLHVRGFKNTFIANYVKCHRKTVASIIKQWKDGTLCTATTKKRQPKLSAPQVFKVLDYFIHNPFSTYKECIKKLKLFVSCMTIQRVLTKNGVRNYVAASKQFLSMQNQIKRLRFAIKYQHWTSEWLRVFFLDEKTVQTYTDGRVFVKRRRDERFDHNKMVIQEVQNTKNKVNLVGIVSFNGRNVVYSVSNNLTGLEFEALARSRLIEIVRGSTVY